MIRCRVYQIGPLGAVRNRTYLPHEAVEIAAARLFIRRPFGARVGQPLEDGIRLRHGAQ